MKVVVESIFFQIDVPIVVGVPVLGGRVGNDDGGREALDIRAVKVFFLKRLVHLNGL